MPQASPGSADVVRFAPGDDAAAFVDEWLSRPALRRLVEAFDGAWPTGTLRERLDALVAFSSVWDRRAGASRLDIVEDAEQGARIDVLSAAAELGLIDQPPLSADSYDWVFVLGGLVTGCLSRVEAVSGLLEGGLSTGGVALLGSFRELHVDERELAESAAGAHATTEVDLLAEFAAKLLPGNGRWETQTDGDRDTAPRLSSKHAWRGGELPVHVFASASSEPDVRPANTADTYRQAAVVLPVLPGQRILLVTTRIYRYQALDAIRVLGLPFGASVELFGTTGAGSRRDFGPAWYLQEVRSMLNSSRALLASLD